MTEETAHELNSASEWSDRALRRLVWLRAGGLSMVVIGALAFVIGARQRGIGSSFIANGGLTLLVTGLVIIAAVVRTRRAHPNRPFTPRSIVSPRMWFVLTWMAGVGVAVVLLSTRGSATTEQIIMLMFATTLMVLGGFWLLHGLSGQLARRWPSDPAAPLKLVPGWTIVWAGVWGLFSTIVAFVIESLPVLLLAIVFRTAFTDVSRSTINSLETITRVMQNPLLLVLVFCGAVIAAPIVEEAIKAFGLYLLHDWIQQPADGWLLGLGAGLGFGVLEGAFNLDAPDSWFVGAWIRLAALLLHGLATSLTGLGYARSLRSQQRGPLLRGYRNAVILHGLWNASAVGIALAAGASGLGVFSIQFLVACGSLLLLVGLAVFLILLVRRVARAGVETSVQEGFQQAGMTLPPSWSPADYNLGWRFVDSRPEYVFATATAPTANPPVQASGEATSHSETNDQDAATTNKTRDGGSSG